jgi:hypothetical protein
MTLFAEYFTAPFFFPFPINYLNFLTVVSGQINRDDCEEKNEHISNLPGKNLYFR